MVAQPDKVLAARSVQSMRIGVPYIMPYLDMNTDMFVHDIRKNMPPHLDSVQESVYEDIRAGIDAAFGVGQQKWKQVCFFKILQDVMTVSISRVFVGPTLCNDKGYQKTMIGFLNHVGFNGVVVGQLVPSILRPVIGYTAAIPAWFLKRRWMGYLVPVVIKRMEDLKRKKMDPTYDYEEPNDVISWMVADVLDEKNPRINTPETLAEHIIFFVSTQSQTTPLYHHPQTFTSQIQSKKITH